MKLIKTIVASVLVVGMGSAFAAEPVTLNEAQMDNVNAAGYGTADALATALGLFGAATLTTTQTSVYVLHVLPTQGGQITLDKTISLSHAEGVAL